ncbi:mechanosensitive ion channel family protein [Vagococcus zengguangii]|uniref:Mechanosensitive ion channel family protein n=1 Tax=Vagococcus zengguangii TaxID=2571750 RepID=A0A4D7CTL4_9ENTE|nr:mechanosensitive ion channel family protein [Vagococcus zengguangii]QCI86553.1 mechanosensitive ion channel family protein [Vagococcus zengguangii]TLG81198.1 mechanosensitive ion channel family protein [Vagococcus zengguangii]
MLLLTAQTTTSDTFFQEDTVQKFGVLSEYWQSIDWSSILSLIINKSILIIATTVLILFIKKIGQRLIKRSFQNKKFTENHGQNRIDTLYALTKNVFSYILLFIYLYTLLTIIGIPVGSLIAGAGIAGVAIGLGAQGFINDLITGFFIIFEKQIEVGDYVIINESEGTVQSVGLRTTKVKSTDGVVHFIPNRSILVISNFSKANRLAVIQLRINPNSDLELIKQIVTDVNQQLTPLFPEIEDEPNIVGVVDTGNGNLALKVVIPTLNGAQVKVQTKFLEEYLLALKAAGIELPTSPINLSDVKK